MRCQEKRTHSEFLTRKRCVAPRLLLSSRRSTSRAPDKLHDRLDRTRPPFTDRFIGDSLLQNQRAFGIELWRFFLISWPSDRAQVTAHERGTRERERSLYGIPRIHGATSCRSRVLHSQRPDRGVHSACRACVVSGRRNRRFLYA